MKTVLKLSMSLTSVVVGPTVVGSGGRPSSVSTLLQKCWQLFLKMLYLSILSRTLSAVWHISVSVVRIVAHLVTLISQNLTMTLLSSLTS